MGTGFHANFSPAGALLSAVSVIALCSGLAPPA